MLVVSDSSPINFLVRLSCINVLPTLYGTVLVPPTVVEELTRPATPQVVKDFMSNIPDWLQVRAPTLLEAIPKLDPGEVAAISLATEVRADFIFLDDGAAREAAMRRGLAVTGLLGILARADDRGLLSLVEVASRLPADYRIDRTIVDAAIERRRRRGTE